MSDLGPPSGYETWTDEEKWAYLSRHERLGEVLIYFNKIPLTDIERLLLVQREKGGHLGELIVAAGLLTVDEMLEALHLQHNCDLAAQDSIEALKRKQKD